MTDDPTTDHVPGDADPATDLAGAYLDGEATDAEVARVEAEPALLERVAELEALRDRLAVPAPPRSLVDDHVGVALDAFAPPAAGSGAGTPATATPADELAARRARRDRRWYERIPLGAVAAAVVVVALVGAISQLSTGESDDMAADTAGDALESADDAGEAADSAGDDSAEDDDSEEGADQPAAESDVGVDEQTGATRLAFADVDALADHLATRLDAADGATATTSTTGGNAQSDTTVGEAGARCALDALAGVDQDEITAVEPAVVAGRDVTALVLTSDARRLVVVDDATCDVIADRAF